MPDPRHQRLARVLINYSLKIKPGDKLQVYTQSAAAPLIREVYREALLAGAFPTVRTMLGPVPSGIIALDGMTDVLLREGSDEQLRYLSELDRQEMEYCDARLVILAQDNTRGLSGADPARIAMLQQGHAPLMARFMERSAAGELRWCATLFPTQAHAQDAGMSLQEYEDFVYRAGLLDERDPVEAWRRVHAEQQRIADYLARHDEIHIVAPDTDITYRVGGRTWLNASGSHNFPDGEVFTGPHEESVNGTVRFSYPVVYSGQEVEDVRLTFKDGKVVEATAARGQELMLRLIDQDPGARYVGEVAFGLNYGIQRFSRLILFDEKIGGTMHMALGRAYAETGGKNQSALHWDMICDLRAGEVYADGELCYREGKFII
jgi:aminopeptidase